MRFLRVLLFVISFGSCSAAANFLDGSPPLPAFCRDGTSVKTFKIGIKYDKFWACYNNITAPATSIDHYLFMAAAGVTTVIPPGVHPCRPSSYLQPADVNGAITFGFIATFFGICGVHLGKN